MISVFIFFTLIWFTAALNEITSCPPILGTGLTNGGFKRIGLQGIKVHCDPGYLIIGPKKLRCRNGKWNLPLNFQCVRPENECPPAPELENGILFGDDRTEGSLILYSCNPGFTIAGSSKRHCTKNRQWSGVTPSCIANFRTPEDIIVLLENQLQLREQPNNEIETLGRKGRILGPEIYKVGLELIFLLDRSSSIDPVDFHHAKDFISFLIETFGVNNKLNDENGFGIRVGLITFGTKAEVLFNLNDKRISSPEIAAKLIAGIKDGGGGTAMQPALTMVITEMLGNFRPKAKKAVFLMTDGEPNIGDVEPEEIAKVLRDMNVEIFSIGVGRDISRPRLVKIASEPAANHVFFLEKFGDFEKILHGVRNHPPTTQSAPTAAPPGPKACGISKKDSDSPYPWLVAIFGQSEIEPIRFCSGVLICAQWILTSAACVLRNNSESETFPRPQVSVILSENNLTSLDPGEISFYVAIIHLSPKEEANQNGELRLALLKLHVPAKLKGTYRPVCLPITKGAIEIPLHTNYKLEAFLEGWGAYPLPKFANTAETEVNGNYVVPNFRRTRMPYLEENLCSIHLTRTFNVSHNSTKKLMCTGNKVNNHEDWTCSGNYGSPLVAQEPKSGRYQLIGIQGSQSGCTNRIGVFVVVSFYIEWIRNTTSKCFDTHDY